MKKIMRNNEDEAKYGKMKAENSRRRPATRSIQLTHSDTECGDTWESGRALQQPVNRSCIYFHFVRLVRSFHFRCELVCCTIFGYRTHHCVHIERWTFFSFLSSLSLSIQFHFVSIPFVRSDTGQIGTLSFGHWVNNRTHVLCRFAF